MLITVIIGVDPHKASHTAVAICGDERELATLTERATCQQTAKLLAWAEPFEERSGAIESPAGLGYTAHLRRGCLVSAFPGVGGRTSTNPDRRLNPWLRP